MEIKEKIQKLKKDNTVIKTYVRVFSSNKSANELFANNSYFKSIKKGNETKKDFFE